MQPFTLVIKICKAILVLLWQNTENEKNRTEVTEREGRLVNLQTVLFNMLSLSCDSRANIMVSLSLTQWEFWQNEAITQNTYNYDYCDKRNRDFQSPCTCAGKPQKVPHTSSESLIWLVMLDNKVSSVFWARYFPSFFMLCLACELCKESKSESQQGIRSFMQVFSAYLWMTCKSEM